MPINNDDEAGLTNDESSVITALVLLIPKKIMTTRVVVLSTRVLEYTTKIM
jgi:hypothetical protein